MKKLFLVLIVLVAVFTLFGTASTMAAGFPTSQASCETQRNKTFFGLPTWYKYLPYNYVSVTVGGQTVGECRVDINLADEPEELALIGFAVIDILLRLGGLIAVVFVTYGGILYILSRGEPDKAASAKSTILNAIIGLAFVIIASPLVAFLAKRLSS